MPRLTPEQEKLVRDAIETWTQELANLNHRLCQTKISGEIEVLSCQIQTVRHTIKSLELELETGVHHCPCHLKPYPSEHQGKY